MAIMKIEGSNIGFVGLGGMGQLMARRLIEQSFRLTVYDRTAERMNPLVAAGARAAHSLKTIGEESDVILSCVHKRSRGSRHLHGLEWRAGLRQAWSHHCRDEYSFTRDFAETFGSRA